MALILSTPFGAALAVTVDHDPTIVATDVPAGSCILFENGGGAPKTYIKLDDGNTTNVRKIAEMKPDGTLEVVGSAAPGDLDRVIVDVDDVKLATVAGYMKVNVTDEGSQISDQDYFVPIYTLA